MVARVIPHGQVVEQLLDRDEARDVGPPGFSEGAAGGPDRLIALRTANIKHPSVLPADPAASPKGGIDHGPQPGLIERHLVEAVVGTRTLREGNSPVLIPELPQMRSGGRL